MNGSFYKEWSRQREESDRAVRFKLLDMPWNMDEQYEMLVLPFVEWSWLIQFRANYESLRPELEKLFRWVPYYENGRYDAALLHLDLEPIEPLKHAQSRRRAYEELDGLIKDIPKVVIVHGSRVATRESARAVRDLIGDNYAVVGSEALAEQLGTGHVIEPGLITDNWRDLPKEPRVVTNRYRLTARGVSLVEELREALEAVNIDLCVVGTDFVPKTWEDYRDFLGRSLIYFAPHACSERAKLEAMLSGCCVVSLDPSNSEDAGVAKGAFEYLVPSDPRQIADLIEELIIEPARASEMGRAARRAAARSYDWTRHSQAWLKCLDAVVNAPHALWSAR